MCFQLIMGLCTSYQSFFSKVVSWWNEFCSISTGGLVKRDLKDGSGLVTLWCCSKAVDRLVYVDGMIALESTGAGQSVCDMLGTTPRVDAAVVKEDFEGAEPPIRTRLSYSKQSAIPKFQFSWDQLITLHFVRRKVLQTFWGGMILVDLHPDFSLYELF